MSSGTGSREKAGDILERRQWALNEVAQWWRCHTLILRR